MRVEPFSLARNEVSPMVDCSLPLPFLGRTRGRKHSPTSADVGNCLALLSLSVQGYALHGQLSIGAVKLLTSAGCWQSSRPGRPNSRAISESADKPQTLLRDSGIADGQSFFSLLAWESWSSPKAVTVVMSAAGANVTTATAFAFRSGTDGSEGHRAIADMRWLAARVARPLGR